jgi:hypothetical protein
MYFISLASALPEIGKAETRSIHVFQDPKVPDGSYAFIEFYCIDPECDCQLVRFVVLRDDGQVHASISYGWNSKTFYDKAFSSCDHNFPGPDFAILQPQGPYAEGLLDLCKTALLSDKAYIERLKRHNGLFKEEARKRDLFELIDSPSLQKSIPLGRNAPCSCGSGKKYKKCCY